MNPTGFLPLQFNSKSKEGGEKPSSSFLCAEHVR